MASKFSQATLMFSWYFRNVVKGSASRLWLVVAMVILVAGFAPIFHSICIDDSSVMSLTHSAVNGAVMPAQQGNSHHSHNEQPWLPGDGTPLALVAMLVLPACISLCAFFAFLRRSRCRPGLVSGCLNSLPRPPSLSFFPNSVNRLRLGVSRT